MDLAPLLQPISPDRPSGADLRYEPVYDQIREARRQEMGGPMGAWERQVKTADFRLVIRLATQALTSKTKDLQIATWLAEAWIWEFHLTGLNDSIQLLRGLLDGFWESVYPELEDDDSEMRAAPIDWFGNYLDASKGRSPALAVFYTPLNEAGHTLMQFVEARTVGYENQAKGEAAKKREQLISEGKLAPEAFDKAFDATPKTFYKDLSTQIQQAEIGLTELASVCDEKFGRSAPSFQQLRKALEELETTCRVLLKKKLDVDPDPVEAPVGDPEAVTEAEPEAVAAPPDQGAGAVLAGPVAPVSTPADARMAIIAAAHFLRRRQPQDPSSYLTLRALRWGELRAGGEAVDPALLVAPSTETRKALRHLAAQSKWADLLDAAEMAMGSECGRGWLDLQRYAIKASEELGHTMVHRSLRFALKGLLAEYPNLGSMIMSDDTGTANPETLSWLAQLS